MPRLITLQPSPVTDHITDDGTELTQLPYPFHVEPDGKTELFGEPYEVVGFQDDLAVMKINHYWEEIVNDPQSAVGKYLVTRDRKGGYASWPAAIMRVEVHE